MTDFLRICLTALHSERSVPLVRQRSALGYFDKRRLDRDSIGSVPNESIKGTLGFSK